MSSDDVSVHAKDVALKGISVSVAKLWKAVEDGRYDARSIVGDETLNMKEFLDSVGIELPLEEAE